MHNDYRFHREKYVEADVCFTPDDKTPVIKGIPIHCHPLDIIRFGEYYDSVK